jgi:hypothetical protein
MSILMIEWKCINYSSIPIGDFFTGIFNYARIPARTKASEFHSSEELIGYKFLTLCLKRMLKESYGGTR